jgi:hypothetical protein
MTPPKSWNRCSSLTGFSGDDVEFASPEPRDGEDVLWDEWDAADEFGSARSKFVKLSDNQEAHVGRLHTNLRIDSTRKGSITIWITEL